MPITIKDSDLESDLVTLGQGCPIPVTKRRVAITILEAAVKSAHRRRVPIARIINELDPPKPKQKTKRQSRAKQPANPLRLTQPSAT